MAGQEEAVVDASVAVKWFSDEEGTANALIIRQSHVEGERMLIAPDLILYELSNALRFKPGFDQDMVARAVEDLLNIQIELIGPTKELIKESSALAYRCGITIYDSCYIALGQLLGIHVYTSDKQLYQQAKETGIIKLIDTQSEH